MDSITTVLKQAKSQVPLSQVPSGGSLNYKFCIVLIVVDLLSDCFPLIAGETWTEAGERLKCMLKAV